MSYDTMPAGREMDALVAEKVMGCTGLVRKDYSWKHTGGDIDGFSGTVWFCKCPGMHNAQSEDGLIKPYSTSISAAWEVVEKIVADGGGEVSVNIKNLAHRLSCVVTVSLGNWRKGYADAVTVPLAICSAALKAVEGK